jgi:hypothetical protein
MPRPQIQQFSRAQPFEDLMIDKRASYDANGACLQHRQVLPTVSSIEIEGCHQLVAIFARNVAKSPRPTT